MRFLLTLALFPLGVACSSGGTGTTMSPGLDGGTESCAAALSCGTGSYQKCQTTGGAGCVGARFLTSTALSFDCATCDNCAGAASAADQWCQAAVSAGSGSGSGSGSSAGGTSSGTGSGSGSAGGSGSGSTTGGTGSGGSCAASATAVACEMCCYSSNAASAKSYVQLTEACACTASTCQADCASSLCAATAASPTAGCQACLETQCMSVPTSCMADGQCGAFYACLASCPM